MYDEKEILLRIASGDEAAFTILFNVYHQRLGKHIFSIVKSHELTEEIVQDVFLKIWMSRETLAEVRSFKDYLFIMSRNQALSGLKKVLGEQKRKKGLEKLTFDVADEGADQQKETGLSLIDKAIGQLPPRQQECFILSRKKRLTYVEIGRELGIGRESVKTHIELAVKGITRFVTEEMDKILLVIPPFLLGLSL